MTRDLPDMIREAAQHFGSKSALAHAVGINASRLSRLAHHGEYSLNIENCLRLAKVAGLPASDVLRAAGKGDIADLIESLYDDRRGELIEYLSGERRAEDKNLTADQRAQVF